MKTAPQHKIVDAGALTEQARQWKADGKTIAFTNGCFDLLHAGHIATLTGAAAEADVLVVGLNADTSVKKLKGEGRPVNDEQARATVLAALEAVDAVVIFSEETPLKTILSLKPDVLVKGGDYTPESIVGAKEVASWGGKVVVNPIVPGFSTTTIIEKLAVPSPPNP